MELNWQDFIASREVIVAMRFSYFGNSGWKSDFSKDKEMLFATDRLEARFDLLRRLPLPSLAAQTDQNFNLAILCSDVMPEWAHQKLAEICAQALPAARFTIVPRRYGFAHLHFRRMLTRRYGSGFAIQTVLDDDDAFAVDLIAALRQQLALMPPLTDPADMRFVSFARGYGVDLSQQTMGDIGLYHHRYPYINLGLTMVSDVGGQNLYSIRHRKTPLEYPCNLVEGAAMFVRSVHEINDSRVGVSERWKPIVNWRSTPEVMQRFPYLPHL